ncbi:MAG: YibE/F family protein [Syntrophomonadaceae bacterium]
MAGDIFREVYVKGAILKILAEEEIADPMNPDSGKFIIQQSIEVSLTDPFAGEKIIIKHTASKTNPMLGAYLTVGDRVIVYANVDAQDKIIEAHVANLDRSKTLVVVTLAFVAVLVILGGRKGVGALMTIMLTGLLIWYGLIPLILRGASPVWCGALVCAVVTLAGTPMISGFNRTSLAAIIGSIAGVILAGILASLAGSSASIVGIDFEHANMLKSLPLTANLNLQGIFLAGVLIGALGAVMDTSISIASSIREFAEIHSNPTRYHLWRAGMNVGKDVMGMMSSTLILAYTGGALALLLLLVANHIPAVNIMNWDMIVSEIIRSMAGSIGLCLSIPVTALAASHLVGKKTEK